MSYKRLIMLRNLKVLVVNQACLVRTRMLAPSGEMVVKGMEKKCGQINRTFLSL